MSRAREWRLLERAGGLVAQLIFIAAGVYLGNRADAWKEERSHREAARATLENFRTELRANREALEGQTAYHARLARGFATMMEGPAGPPRTLDDLFARVNWHGSGSIGFRHTAWDLALANQSLGYIEPRLAFAIADVYMVQRGFDDYQLTTQRAALNPASLRPDALGGLSMTLGAFYNDAVHGMEPQLARMYAAVIPRIDSAITKAPK